MNDGLSLEKLRISERLEKLEGTVSNYTAVNELRMKQNDEMIYKLNHIIVGNGTPGLAEKVRKFEEGDKSRQWWHKTVGASLVGLFIEMVWRHIVGHGK